jgi:hypothetical protein
MPSILLTESFVFKVVNRYIGVKSGYLGDFTWRTHREFYLEYCGVNINPDEFEGTTRERFIAILSGADPRLQASILRGVIQRFPVGHAAAPESRTEALREQLETMIHELERGSEPEFQPTVYSVEIVNKAIADAETLLKVNGATSALDRIHTALHGFLLRVCRDVKIDVTQDLALPALFKLLKAQHPAFQAAGPRSQDVLHIMRAVGSILDVMNPLRNQASMAHPNEELLGPEEALLVINVARSILHYLNTKLPRSSTE